MYLLRRAMIINIVAVLGIVKSYLKYLVKKKTKRFQHKMPFSGNRHDILRIHQKALKKTAKSFSAITIC